MTWFAANSILIQSTLTTLILALSIQVPLRLGVFSFAGVGAFGIGGYTAAIAMTRFDWGTVSSIILGTVVAGVAVVLLGMIINRLTGLYLGMATIAFTLIVTVIAVNGGDLTGGASDIFGAVGDVTLGGLFVCVLVVVALLSLTERGKLSRQIDAVREDPELAASLGVNVTMFRRASFLISGLIGGLAGGLTTLLRTTITPAEVTFHLVVLALTVIVVGGAGSWVGALIGSVIFVWLPTLLEFVSQWEELIYGVIVVLAAIFLPKGVLGLIQDTVHRIRVRNVKQPKIGSDKPKEIPLASAPSGLDGTGVDSTGVDSTDLDGGTATSTRKVL